MKEFITMSEKELDRLKVMQQLESKQLRQKEAAQMLRLSIRQVKRIWRRYKLEGARGLISRHRGQLSNNRMHDEKQRLITTLLYAHYHDFGPTLAQEKLTETHHIRVSVETIRKLMIAERLWRPRRVKEVRLHPLRQRRACLGELIQIDGSPHRWFEGRAPACTLLVFIDDATGRLMTLLFVPSETTFAYFEATRHYLLQHGKPIAFYSDRHSIFRVNTRNALSGTGLTQFGRAARDLGIEIICANTPQAKGRVERANQTLQDRLVKEMRLRGISSMKEGNSFVQEFMDDFNARFAVTPRSDYNAHKPLLPSEDLEHIFTLQETRVLSKNLSLQYQNVVYQIQTDRPTYALRFAKVTVCEDQQGNIRVLYKGKPLNFSVFHRQEKQGEIIPSKLVDAKLQSVHPTHHRPADTHPWRNYGYFHKGTKR